MREEPRESAPSSTEATPHTDVADTSSASRANVSQTLLPRQEILRVAKQKEVVVKKVLTSVIGRALTEEEIQSTKEVVKFSSIAAVRQYYDQNRQEDLDSYVQKQAEIYFRAAYAKREGHSPSPNSVERSIHVGVSKFRQTELDNKQYRVNKSTQLVIQRMAKNVGIHAQSYEDQIVGLIIYLIPIAVGETKIHKAKTTDIESAVQSVTKALRTYNANTKGTDITSFVLSKVKERNISRNKRVFKDRKSAARRVREDVERVPIETINTIRKSLSADTRQKRLAAYLGETGSEYDLQGKLIHIAKGPVRVHATTSITSKCRPHAISSGLHAVQVLAQEFDPKKHGGDFVKWIMPYVIAVMKKSEREEEISFMKKDGFEKLQAICLATHDQEEVPKKPEAIEPQKEVEPDPLGEIPTPVSEEDVMYGERQVAWKRDLTSQNKLGVVRITDLQKTRKRKSTPVKPVIATESAQPKTTESQEDRFMKWAQEVHEVVGSSAKQVAKILCGKLKLKGLAKVVSKYDPNSRKSLDEFIESNRDAA